MEVSQTEPTRWRCACKLNVSYISRCNTVHRVTQLEFQSNLFFLQSNNTHVHSLYSTKTDMNWWKTYKRNEPLGETMMMTVTTATTTFTSRPFLPAEPESVRAPPRDILHQLRKRTFGDYWNGMSYGPEVLPATQSSSSLSKHWTPNNISLYVCIRAFI